MTKFDDYLKEQLKDPGFRREYEALQPEMEITRRRIEKGITQQQLAQRAGIGQSDISRIESGAANPSLKTLKKIADGLGCKLSVQFLPLSETGE